jgi:spore coat protein U-like protein
MFKKIAIASAAAALFGIGQSATAGQTSNTMNVTANVNANCVVTTAPSDFTGAYDPVGTNATTPAGDLTFTQSIVFKCTKSSSGVTTGITNGANFSSGRRLADTGAANFLNYDLYQPAAVGAGASCAYSQAYSTAGAGLFAVTGANFTTSTTAVTVKICGKIPGAQDVPATGAYTDAVTVNVNF